MWIWQFGCNIQMEGTVVQHDDII